MVKLFIFLVLSFFCHGILSLTRWDIENYMCHNDLLAIENLLKIFPIDKQVEGKTLLHYAIAHESLGAVKLLLDRGADYEMIDITGISPMQRAMREGCWEIVLELIQRGASNTSGQSDEFLFFIAACAGHESVSFFINLGFKLSSIKITSRLALLMLAFEHQIPILPGIIIKYPQSAACITIPDNTDVQSFAQQRNYALVLQNFCLVESCYPPRTCMHIEDAVVSQGKLYLADNKYTQELYAINQHDTTALEYIAAVDQGNLEVISSLLMYSSPTIVKDESGTSCLYAYSCHTLSHSNNVIAQRLLIVSLLEKEFTSPQ